VADDKLTRAQFAAKLKNKYPQYAQVPDDHLVDVVLAKYPTYKDQIMDVATLPPGTISGPPKGIAAVKAGGYGAVAKAADWIKNNFDLIGGTLGGAAGLPGGPPGAVGGAALGGAAGRAVRQLAGFAEGKPKRTNAEAIKDIALGGLEQGAYELGGWGISKLGKAIAPAGRSSLLAYGARAGEMGPKLDRLMPEFDKTIARTGGQTPKTIGDFDKLVHATERQLNTEFSIALQPIAGQPVVPITVAQAIRDQISPNLQKTATGRATTSYLKRRALDFETQTWSIRELNAERELITKRLRAWHNAVASGQVAQARVEGHIAADTAAERALKDLLYDAADRSGAKPPGYFRILKQKQSDLIDLADYVAKNKERLSKASMEREGGPFMEKIHLRAYGHPATGMPGGVMGISPSMFADPEKQSAKAIQKAFPEGWRKAARVVRGAVGGSLSKEQVDALSLRLLFSNDAQQEGAP